MASAVPADRTDETSQSQAYSNLSTPTPAVRRTQSGSSGREGVRMRKCVGGVLLPPFYGAALVNGRLIADSTVRGLDRTIPPQNGGTCLLSSGRKEALKQFLAVRLLSAAEERSTERREGFVPRASDGQIGSSLPWAEAEQAVSAIEEGKGASTVERLRGAVRVAPKQPVPVDGTRESVLVVSREERADVPDLLCSPSSRNVRRSKRRPLAGVDYERISLAGAPTQSPQHRPSRLAPAKSMRKRDLVRHQLPSGCLSSPNDIVATAALG